MTDDANDVTLGLRANVAQFSLLVVVNAFVGAMAGLERSILPAIAEQEFGLAARSAILSFIVVFGVTKALTNYGAGRWSDSVGRKRILVLGWLVATPVPFLLMWAPSWAWILFANALLGVSLDLDAVRDSVTDRTLVVSVVHAQNEIGTLQPLSDIAMVAHERGTLVHTDAAQTVGKIPVNVRELGVDLLSMAGNKFYAPKGAGALYVRRGIELESLIHGGGHERGRRAGTENAAFAVGLGRAAALAAERLPLYTSHVRPLRDRLHTAVLTGVPDLILNGHIENRLPTTLNVSFPGVDSIQLQTRVRGRLACSTGSSCHDGVTTPSPTLLAIGRDTTLATAALRLTVGIETTLAEIDEAGSILTEAVNGLRAVQGASNA